MKVYKHYQQGFLTNEHLHCIYKDALKDEAIRLAGNWCPASEISAGIYIRGALGMVAGCQIIVSNKLAKANTSYIIKPNALRIFLKRDMAVEVDRDIIHKTTYITADKHYVTYLYYESKAIKLMKAA